MDSFEVDWGFSADTKANDLEERVDQLEKRLDYLKAAISQLADDFGRFRRGIEADQERMNEK